MANVKINFQRELVDFYGKPIKTADTTAEPEGKYPDGADRFPIVAMSLMKACTNAIAGEPMGEKLTPEQKVKRWRIGCKIAKAAVNPTGIVALKSEEITDVLNACKAAYPPFIAGVIAAMLDPSDEDKAMLDGLGKPDHEPQGE